MMTRTATQARANSKGASEQSLFLALAAIMVFAVAFGGGGSKYGLANLVVQLAALVALSFHRHAFFAFWSSAPMGVRIITGLTILLPVLHLIPLPAGLWSSLPGREAVAQSFELIGDGAAASGWASASVDPGRTLLALTAIIAPLAVLAIGFNAARDRLLVVGWIVVALGLVNFLLGVPQVLGTNQTGLLFPENVMPGVLFGTFANRNSTGLFLVAALALAAFLPAHPKFGRNALPIRIAICVLLVVAIVLTRSRTAIVLALIPLGLVALRFGLAQLRARRGDAPSRPWLAAIPAVIVIAVVAALIVTSPGRVGMAFDRFGDTTEDARAYIWDDAAYSAQRYFPVGSGMGTFDEVFQLDESLENMTLRRAGRAHNDYLEVAIEAGLPGIALIVGWLAMIAWMSWQARHSRDRWIAWSGGAILLAVALQSITDYPLRNHSMLAVAALAFVILARFGAIGRDAENGESA